MYQWPYYVNQYLSSLPSHERFGVFGVWLCGHDGLLEAVCGLAAASGHHSKAALACHAALDRPALMADARLALARRHCAIEGRNDPLLIDFNTRKFYYGASTLLG